MEGKCEDWVLVEKGGGKNVENVDIVSKVMEKKIWRSEIIAVRNFETLPLELISARYQMSSFSLG